MLSNFERAFHELLGHEGGYANHPNDPGGETMWGVTKRVAREYGYEGEMKSLPLETAKQIYRSLYWKEEYDVIPYSVAFNLFDAGVNHGHKRAVIFLQRALDLPEDGILGPNTLSACFSMNPYKVVALFNAERLFFYTKLRAWPSFGKGWSRRVASNLKGVK